MLCVVSILISLQKISRGPALPRKLWPKNAHADTLAEVQALQNALPSRQNIDNKILMWMIHSGSMDGPTSASPTTQKAKKRA